MSKNITITHNDRKYVLEFDKATVKTMERAGFVLEKVGEMPATMIPMLWQGAFVKNEPRLSANVKEEIFDNMSNKTDLILKLMELYEDTLSGLFEDNENSKNSSWEASW